MEKRIDIRSRRGGVRGRRKMELVIVGENGELEFKEVEARRLKVKSVVRFEDDDEVVVREYLKELGKLDEDWKEILGRVRYWLEDEEFGFCIYRFK